MGDENVREVKAKVTVETSGAEKLEGIEKHLGGITKLFGGFHEQISKFREMGKIFVEGFAVDKMKDFIEEQSEAAEHIANTSHMLGMSVEELQRYEYAAKSAGLAPETLTVGLAHLQQELGGANGLKQMLGATGAGGALASMGIHAKDAAGKLRPMQDILLDVSDGLNKLNDQGLRNAKLTEIFGKQGRQLDILLQKGRGGVKELLEQMNSFGTLSEKEIKQFEHATEANYKLKAAKERLKLVVANELLPAFIKVVDIIRAKAQVFIDLAKNTTAVKSAFAGLSVLLGFKVLGQLSKLLGLGKGVAGILKMGGVAVAVAGVYLVFDDLFALFTGKKSMIGETMDVLYGKGYSTEWLDNLKATWDSLVESITGADASTANYDDTLHAIIITFKVAFTQVIAYVIDQIALFSQGISFAITGVKALIKTAMGKDISAELKEGERIKKEMAFTSKDLGRNSLMNLGTNLDKAFKEERDRQFKARMGRQGFVMDEKTGRMHLMSDKDQTRFKRSIVTDQATGKQRLVAREGGLSQREINNYHANGGMLTIHNHIKVGPGADPHKIRKAVDQGTHDALSQNELRSAHRAVVRRAPAQNKNEEVWNP